MSNIHVSLAWMPVKVLLAHGRVISAGTSRNIGRHRGNTFNVAAPGESREPHLNIVRLTLFGCSRHPDNLIYFETDTIGDCISAWRRGGDYTQGAFTLTKRHRSPPCIPHCALHSKTLQLNLGEKFIPAENRPFTRQSTPSMAPINIALI